MSDYNGQKSFKRYGSGGYSNGNNYRNNDRGYQGNNRASGDNNGYQQNNWKRNNNFGNKPVEHDPYIPVAFFSNPEAPLDVINKFKELAKRLSDLGFTIRIPGGNSEADDSILEVSDKLEVYLPWKGFNDIEDSYSYFSDESSISQSCKYHPAADKMKEGAKKFLSRNYRLLQGKNLKSAAKFIVIWSEDGVNKVAKKTFKTGPVGHLISIASAIKTPVFNLGAKGVFEEIMELLEPEKEVEYKREERTYNDRPAYREEQDTRRDDREDKYASSYSEDFDDEEY